jgi:hypothetical protein
MSGQSTTFFASSTVAQVAPPSLARGKRARPILRPPTTLSPKPMQAGGPVNALAKA